MLASFRFVLHRREFFLPTEMSKCSVAGCTSIEDDLALLATVLRLEILCTKAYDLEAVEGVLASDASRYKSKACNHFGRPWCRVHISDGPARLFLAAMHVSRDGGGSSNVSPPPTELYTSAEAGGVTRSEAHVY